MDFTWLLEGHRDKAEALISAITDACAKAEKSKRFIDMQLNPRIEWKGWPTEVAETWLAGRPSVLGRYLNGEAEAVDVQRALQARLQDIYRPGTGNPNGRPPKEPVPGLKVPAEVSDTLDSVTWDAMRAMGGRPDLVAIRQAVKVPSPTDTDGDDTRVVILSAGTVTGPALEARYTSIRGDLYWSDIRNTLQLWIMARPELVEAFEAWDAQGQPRAWEPGGAWVPNGAGGRVEHNPLILVRTSAYRAALAAISQWRNDGTISLDAILASGEEALVDAKRPDPQRVQHKPLTGHEHYAWGLRDRVDCYNFPVVTVGPCEGC